MPELPEEKNSVKVLDKFRFWFCLNETQFDMAFVSYMLILVKSQHHHNYAIKADVGMKTTITIYYANRCMQEDQSRFSMQIL